MKAISFQLSAALLGCASAPLSASPWFSDGNGCIACSTRLKEELFPQVKHFKYIRGLEIEHTADPRSVCKDTVWVFVLTAALNPAANLSID